MRIHRIKLINYRGVDEAEVRFPDAGVTIVEGENEVGKTSLAEAMDLVLGERHDSTKRAVKAVKPVGKDVGAEVEIELTTGPYRIRYRKRWHRKKETVLEVLAPDRAQLSGREAHDRVREILDETLDGGLWDALRLRQGRQLEQAAFAGGSLGRALDLAAGGESAGEREDDLWASITAERDRYWTSTGLAKVERTKAESDVRAALEKVAEMEADLLALEQDADQVERLTAERVELIDKQERHTHVLDELTRRYDSIETYRNEVARLTGLDETAQVLSERSQEKDRARVELANQVGEAGEAVAALEAELAEALPARSELDERVRSAQTAVDLARSAVREADTAHRLAIEDRDYRRQEIELAQLSERHDRVESALRRRADAEAVLVDNHVDAALAERIDAAHLELAKAEAAATSGAAVVDATAERDLSLEVDGATIDLVAGDQHEIVVAGSVQVDLPGTMSLRVRAGSEASAMAEHLEEARASFEALCLQGHVAGLAEARQAATERADAERVLAEVGRSIEQDLRDLTPEALAQKIDHLTARIAAFEAGRAPEPAIPADLDLAQDVAAESDTLLQDCRDNLERLDRDLSGATDAVREADLGGAESKARLEQAHVGLAQARSSLETAREEVSDEELAEQSARADSARKARSEELAAAESRLAAEDPDSAEELLENAKAVRKRLVDELHDNEIATRDLRTKLSLKGEEGLAHKLDTAKSELVHLRTVHERLEARAAAAKLLHDAFAERRTEAQHRYVAPFRDRIEQLGRLVFGPGLEVDLGDDLCIERRTLDGVTIDFDDLSTGAQEQLGMISRLACASIVSAEGGAPVIFDDALGWSDPRRLDRMGAVISNAGRSCQIIVLTCTPGRYESVGSATVVKLPC